MKAGTKVKEVGGRQRAGFVHNASSVPMAYEVRLTHIDGREVHEVNVSSVTVYKQQFDMGRWVVTP